MEVVFNLLDLGRARVNLARQVVNLGVGVLFHLAQSSEPPTAGHFAEPEASEG